MNERQGKIVAKMGIGGIEEYFTSEYFAKLLRVSTRTIKNDMYYIDEELKNYGAHLVSKRNRGYKLEVLDNDKFKKYIIGVGISDTNDSERDANETDMRLSIARKLVSSKNGVFVEELEEKYNYARSSLTNTLKWVNRYFTSYHLKVESSQKFGKRVSGNEAFLRLSMVELLAIHYHETSWNEEDEEFLHWFECENEERKRIRHTFLKVLRESDYSCRDSNTQRMAMYLVITYNRFHKGYRLNISKKFMEEVKKLKIYHLIEDVFDSLGDAYKEIREDANEISFLTILMATSLDITDEAMDDDLVLLVKKDLNRVYQAALNVFLNHQIDLNEMQRNMLKNMVVIILLQTHFSMDGFEKFNYSYETAYLSIPLCLNLAYQLMEVFTKESNTRSSRTALTVFSCFFKSIFEIEEYPIKKQKYLLQAGFGRGFGKMIADKLMTMYPNLIEKIDCVNLYEYRRLENAGYDGWLIDLTKRGGESDLLGYNYALPAAVFSANRTQSDLLSFYNNMLISAYQFREYLPDETIMKVVNNYSYSSEEQTIQLFGLLYGKDGESAERLIQKIHERNNNKSMVFENVVVIYIERKYCKRDIFDIYCLNNQGRWKGRKINYIIFIAMDVQGTLRLKTLDTILNVLCHEKEEMASFLIDQRSTMEHIIRKELRI